MADGRLLVLGALAGLAVASAVRGSGSRGVVRAGRSGNRVTRYVEVTFGSGDAAGENSDDLERLIEDIEGVTEVWGSFTDYAREGEGDTLHVSFEAPEDTIPGIEAAVDNWVSSREGAFWPGEAGDES